MISTQFALPGLSRSYNIVGFFEEWGFQTRVAYSHRGAFLAALNQTDQNDEPVYTAAYGQLDMSASYDITKHFSVFFDGINLTSASTRQYGRFTDQFYSANAGFRPIPGRLPRGAVGSRRESREAASPSRRGGLAISRRPQVVLRLRFLSRIDRMRSALASVRSPKRPCTCRGQMLEGRTLGLENQVVEQGFPAAPLLRRKAFQGQQAVQQAHRG